MRTLIEEYTKCALVILIMFHILSLLVGENSVINDLISADTVVTSDETTTLVNVDHIVPTVNPDDFIVTTSMVKTGEEFVFSGKYEAKATYTESDGSVEKRDISDHVSIYYCGNDTSGIGACEIQVKPDENIDTSFTGRAKYRFVLNFNGVRIVKDVYIYLIYDLDDMQIENYLYGTLITTSDADTAYSNIKYLYLEDQESKVKYYAKANTLNDNSFYFSGVPTDRSYKLYLMTTSNSYELMDLGTYTGGVLNIGSFTI